MGEFYWGKITPVVRRFTPITLFYFIGLPPITPTLTTFSPRTPFSGTIVLVPPHNPHSCIVLPPLSPTLESFNPPLTPTLTSFYLPKLPPTRAPFYPPPPPPPIDPLLPPKVCKEF